MCKPDAPDTSGVQEAARRSAALGDRAFDWFAQEYERTASQRAASQEQANQVSQASLDSMTTQTGLAREYADYNRGTFRPLEQRMVGEAQAYDTPERREAAGNEAVAGVNMQVAAQRAASQRDLERSGVSPETGKSQALMAAGDIGAAKAAAGADYSARRGVETQGWARMSDAANLGRGLPSAQATAASVGTQAAGMALNAGTAGINAGQSGAGLMQTGFSQGLQGQGQSGSLYGQAANIENTSRGQDLGFVSSIFGSAMLRSSPKVKKGRKVEQPQASMTALRDTPIESWRYDPAKGGPADGGKTRIGPMANKANEAMGEDVAPGGELLDIASMLGVVANSVKDVDQRLQRIEGKRA